MTSSLFLAAGLTGCVAPSQTGAANQALASGGLVISQVYGGSGTQTSPYDTDYVVLFNSGSTPVSLATYAVWYHSGSNGGAWTGGTALSATATLAAGQSWLFAGNTPNSGAGAALPTADSTDSTVSISHTSGTIVLGTLVQPILATTATYTDIVGWGSPIANGFAGTAAAAPGITNSLFRGGTIKGCLDAEDNSTDFEVLAAAPINSTATATPCTTTAAVDMTMAGDMTQSSTGNDGSTSSGNDGSTSGGNDGSTSSNGDGGSTGSGAPPVGNQPQQNGTPTYKPGGNLSGGCSINSVGGNAGRVGASGLVATLLAGLAMRLRRRRA